ncbi:MAG: diheme cytochrome c [Gammaproteobacteria bacterium]|nr:diheme cytochrome c [Gammaproteobacteria bacterium]
MRSQPFFLSLLLLSATSQVSAALDVAPVTNKTYQEECSACHMAYQPGFLPARSWQKIFDTLDKHFGENAELSAQQTQALKAYAMENAADHSHYKRSRKIMSSLSASDTPLRISEVSYIQRKHREVPDRLITRNPQIKTLGRCEACHPDAKQGDYNEHRVKIPGANGHWEN